MPNDAYTQQALAADAGFILRVQNALVTIAWQALNEDPTTAGHAARAAYARQVLGDPTTFAKQIAKSIVMRPNVNNFTTSVEINGGIVRVVTASGDADLESQLSTDWNGLAGA